MPPMGKELQRQVDTPESIAIREVENYIEKVERSTESSVRDNQNSQQGAVSTTNSLTSKPLASSTIDPNVKKILLPISEKDVVNGFRGGIFEGVRWLSEWCVMMIKKYPGRVFYSNNRDNSYD